MTDAEKALVEAVVSADMDSLRKGKGFGRERQAVLMERLEREIPGWQQEVRIALRNFMVADRAWLKWQKRLEDAGIHMSMPDSWVSQLWNEVDQELK